ncbi:MAG: HAD family hydrolase [Candidatus Berkiella sp.]
MLNTFLFIDFDNTLMATEQYAVPSLIARFNALYQHFLPKPLTYEEFKKHFHGQARETLCKNLSSHFNIDVDYKALYEKREWRIMQHYQQLPQGVEMAPYALETLQHFSEQGATLALVSNNPIQRALTAMRFAQNKQGDKLASLFKTNFFEAGDVQKPNPDVYLQAMQQVGATPENSFAFEDSITGATAAIKAGLKTFGYTGFADNPESLKEKLLATGCVAVFHSWEAVPELIAQFKPHKKAVLSI